MRTMLRGALLSLAVLLLEGCESAPEKGSYGSTGSNIEHGVNAGSGVSRDGGNRIGNWSREQDPLGYGDAP